MRLRDLPIERKLYLIIVPICLIPAAVFVVLSGWGARVAFERTMGQKLVASATDYADRFDLQLRRRMVSLSRMTPQRLTEMAARRTRFSDAASTTSYFSEWLDASVYYGPDGTARPFTIGRASRPQVELPAATVRYWLGRRAELPREGVMSELTIPDAEGKDVPFVLMAFASENDGIMLFAARMERLLTEYRTNLGASTEQLTIYSQDGRLLYKAGATPIPLEIIDLIGSRGYKAADFMRAELGGRNYLIAYSKAEPGTRRGASFTSPSWIFVVQYDMGDFLGPQDTLAWLSVLIGLGLILLMLGTASLTARWLGRPLRLLRSQADRLAQGDLGVRARVHSRDEIGSLAEAFNTMASRLRATYQSLEERAEESRLRAEHIHLINEIAGAIIRALSLDDIFAILRRELEKVFVFDAIWIARLEGDNNLRITQINPMGLMSIGVRTVIPLSGSAHGHVIAHQETTWAEFGPQQRGDSFEQRIYAAEGYQSFLIAPLPARKGIIGTLTVASLAPDAYNAELTDVLTSLARTVGIAIEQADLFAQISQFAANLERKVEQRTHELDVANQKLILTEKYFATGRMAGNLAHEINNPLGIIKNYIQIVRENLVVSGGGRRKTDPSLDSLEVINEEVNRIARLVRQLLDLHRPVEQKIEPVDLNALVRDILAILGEELHRGGIELTAELQPELPQPVASADLIRQVLINLVRNAQDSMENGGRLTVRTSSSVEWADGEERQSVLVRISDTGCGIAPEHISQVFDPFFSTKSPEKGTGLGLCVSYGIVQMYHGSIDLESEVGKGTTVVVSLPMDERSRAWSERVRKSRTLPPEAGVAP
ncbi:MAG: ATP-binding protein [Candidatus Sumerlaeia bacterium]